MVQKVIRLSKVNVGLIRPCLSFSFSTELKKSEKSFGILIWFAYL